MFKVSDNPDFQDYGGLSVSLINFAHLPWRFRSSNKGTDTSIYRNMPKSII